MSDKTKAELKEQIKIMNHNYQALKEMHERGYQYSVGEIKRLQDELDRTRKALGYAIDVIQTVAKMSDKLSREYGETLVEQLDNIQAYCWQEGYVLTHEEDLERAITALEQRIKQ